ncbi:MAG: type III polyketide synthase [Thermoanaerobaculia bacterium]|nr:type III polyketide synthase [Thermoanaerobaculia bacterium]
MSLALTGIGIAVPGEPVSQTRAAEIARRFFDQTPERERLLPTLFRWTRVDTRHSVLDSWSDEDLAAGRETFFERPRHELDRGPTTAQRMERYEAHAAPLAVDASRSALADAGLDANRITHLVTVSCSGFAAPGVDVALIKRLGLDPGVARSHVGFMGCHAAINGLRVARSFVDADPEARVLLCAVELCTLHVHYGWDPEKIVANAIFSDGAAAVVGSSAENGHRREWQVAANGSRVLDDCEDAMTWKVRDHGFEMTLSPRVPDLIREHVRPWLEEWLGGHGLSIATVGSWAVHPGGPRILGAFEQATGVARRKLETSYKVLARYGNMSSPTVLFLLERLRRIQAPRPAVAIGFGPGLAIEAALIR